MHGSLSKLRWDVERFALPPSKKALLRFRHPRPVPPVLQISFPKSGTHLLERAILLHPDYYRKLTGTLNERRMRQRNLGRIIRHLKPGQLVLSHIHHNPSNAAAVKASGAKLLLQMRDPRDSLLSGVNHVMKNPNHRLHQDLAACSDFTDRCITFFHGAYRSDIMPFKERYLRYRGWMDEGALVIRFRDLVGPQGGGTAERQRSTIQAIFEHIGSPLRSEQEVIRIAENVFSDVSPTFHKGLINQWRENMTDAVKDEFKQHANDWLVEFGYEKDANW